VLVALAATLTWRVDDAGSGSVVVVRCGDLFEAYRLAREEPLDILVVPPDIPRDRLRAFRQRFPPTYGVLVRPVDDDPGVIAIAAALHADGYMAATDDVGDIVHDMVEGLCPMPPPMRRWLLDHHLAVAQGPGIFTRREADVLRHLAAGASNKAIALQLGLSQASVKEYVQRVLWKIGASNRTEAAIRALREGLVP